MNKLSNFYRNTTKRFDVYITVDSVAPNIINDTVTIILNTSKGETPLIDVDADVATQGSSGIAKFTLSASDTDVSHGKYYYEISWTLDSGEIFILDEGTVSILERV